MQNKLVTWLVAALSSPSNPTLPCALLSIDSVNVLDNISKRRDVFRNGSQYVWHYGHCGGKHIYTVNATGSW